ncbi:MAG: Fic family protein [Candidatus Margulisbacteria bacterium]|nr:Fic family protein [Candidatus Margulisiibacteriota bacterium]
MILNNKEAIDYILSHPQDCQTMALKKIEDVHRLLIQKLPGVCHGIRNSVVFILATTYRPLDNFNQLKVSLKETVVVINRSVPVFQKALAAIGLISYGQPFVDCNKRTARLVGNAIFMHTKYAHFFTVALIWWNIKK